MKTILNFNIRPNNTFCEGLRVWIAIFNSLEVASDREACINEIEKDFPDFGKELRREIRQSIIAANYQLN